MSFRCTDEETEARRGLRNVAGRTEGSGVLGLEPGPLSFCPVLGSEKERELQSPHSSPHPAPRLHQGQSSHLLGPWFLHLPEIKRISRQAYSGSQSRPRAGRSWQRGWCARAPARPAWSESHLSHLPRTLPLGDHHASFSVPSFPHTENGRSGVLTVWGGYEDRLCYSA